MDRGHRKKGGHTRRGKGEKGKKGLAPRRKGHSLAVGKGMLGGRGEAGKGGKGLLAARPQKEGVLALAEKEPLLSPGDPAEKGEKKGGGEFSAVRGKEKGKGKKAFSS